MTEQKKRAREYLRRAEEAEAQAERSTDQVAAEGFRNIARQWRHLAKLVIGRRK